MLLKMREQNNSMILFHDGWFYSHCGYGVKMCYTKLIIKKLGENRQWTNWYRITKAYNFVDWLHTRKSDHKIVNNAICMHFRLTMKLIDWPN